MMVARILFQKQLRFMLFRTKEPAPRNLALARSGGG
jgi:hypothetical protein